MKSLSKGDPDNKNNKGTKGHKDKNDIKIAHQIPNQI